MPMTDQPAMLLAGLLLVAGLVTFVVAGRRRGRKAASFGLIVTLIAAFYLYSVFAPASPANATLSIVLFVGSAVLFRILSSFEAPP